MLAEPNLGDPDLPLCPVQGASMNTFVLLLYNQEKNDSRYSQDFIRIKFHQLKDLQLKSRETFLPVLGRFSPLDFNRQCLSRERMLTS